ncbi:MAG TPA: hypothetical protein VIX42_05780 [Edaphobacter sp.]
MAPSADRRSSLLLVIEGAALLIGTLDLIGILGLIAKRYVQGPKKEERVNISLASHPKRYH